jgi:hypothetical protein
MPPPLVGDSYVLVVRHESTFGREVANLSAKTRVLVAEVEEIGPSTLPGFFQTTFRVSRSGGQLELPDRYCENLWGAAARQLDNCPHAAHPATDPSLRWLLLDLVVTRTLVG